MDHTTITPPLAPSLTRRTFYCACPVTARHGGPKTILGQPVCLNLSAVCVYLLACSPQTPRSDGGSIPFPEVLLPPERCPDRLGSAVRRERHNNTVSPTRGPCWAPILDLHPHERALLERSFELAQRRTPGSAKRLEAKPVALGLPQHVGRSSATRKAMICLGFLGSTKERQVHVLQGLAHTSLCPKGNGD